MAQCALIQTTVMNSTQEVIYQLKNTQKSTDNAQEGPQDVQSQVTQSNFVHGEFFFTVPSRVPAMQCSPPCPDLTLPRPGAAGLVLVRSLRVPILALPPGNTQKFSLHASLNYKG